MKKIITSMFFLATALLCNAQSITWQKTYGGTGHEYIHKTIPTSDGGYAFVGYSESTDGDVPENNGMEDLWVAKINSTGTLQWSLSYGGSNDDEGNDIVQSSDGTYYVAGWTDSNDGDVSGNHDAYSSDFWVLHLTSDGTIQKQKCFGGSSDDEADVIGFGVDGNLFIAGTTYSYDGDVSGNHGSYETDAWIVKADTALNLTGQKCVGGNDTEECMDLKPTSDGGCIITGRSYSADGDVTGYHAGSDLLVAKISASLSIEWAKCFGGSETEEGNSIVALSDGSYAVLGYTSTHNNGDVTGHHGAQGSDDFWLLKLTSSGTLSWANCYGGSGDDQANGLEASADGGFAMSGLTNSTDGDVTGFHSAMFEPDIWVAKLDASGTLQWQRCCGGTGQDESFRIFEEGSGVFVVTGFTYSTDYDVALNHGDADGWILKVTGAAAVPEHMAAVSFEVYPNPADDFFYIRNNGTTEELTIEIIDSKGCLIKTYKPIVSLYSAAFINISELETGIYFAKVHSRHEVFISELIKK